MNENRSAWTLPVAIIVFVLIVAGAFYYRSNNPQSNIDNSELSKLLPATEGIDLNKLRPVDSTDHVLGQTTAPIKIVVYTDLECPACKYFHNELKKIESTYVTTGQVAIIYRDFPLDQLHAKVRNEFLAAECVNGLAGNDKFWQFVDKIFEITPSNDGLDPAKLGETAKALGVDTKAFNACMTAKKYADNIQKTVDEATALGAQGTPFFILVTADKTIPVFGGVPAEQLSKIFDLLLGKTVTPAVNGTSTQATPTATTSTAPATASTTTE